MSNLTRRSFFKAGAILGAVIGGAKSARAESKNVLSEDRMGVLVDTTVCIGCRNCEWACKNAHRMVTDSVDSYEDQSVFKIKRRPDETSLTVVNQYSIPSKTKPVYVKVQCMHCDHPACVSACIVGAFSKEETGAVVWDTDKCIGCRYCMVACPFQVPAFEYFEALRPNILKCDFCKTRTTEGLRPACVDICPVEAMTYGPRAELIRVARERIKKNPDRYINHIYGETEVGGTSWMYLAGEEFTNLDFPQLGKNLAPGVSESIQHGIFAYFVPPVSLYALLGGLMWIFKNRKPPESEK